MGRRRRKTTPWMVFRYQNNYLPPTTKPQTRPQKMTSAMSQARTHHKQYHHPSSTLSPAPTKPKSSGNTIPISANLNINIYQTSSKLSTSTSTFSQDISRAMLASSQIPKYASYIEHEVRDFENPPPPPPSPVEFPTSMPNWDAWERKGTWRKFEVLSDGNGW